MALKFKFFRASGLDQLTITDENDLAAVEALDPKLWVAISMPASGLEFDERTLALIDTDNDGRIRLPEIKKAVAFVRENFADLTPFFAGKAEFAKSAIKPESALNTAAERVEKFEQNVATGTISLDQVEKTFANFAAQPFNGDGILTPAAAENDTEVESLIKDLITATAGTEDAAGTLGVTAAQVEQFEKSATGTLAWHEKSAAGTQEIFPLGEAETAAAWGAIEAVRKKIEDFFARTHLASFDPTAVKKLNPTEDEFSALAGGEITGDASKAFPLAQIAPARAGDVPELPLVSGVNPAWLPALGALRALALVPALGVPADVATLSEPQWHALLAKFSAYEAWLGEKPADAISALPIARIREILAQKPTEKLAPIFARDTAEAPQRDSLVNLERLCRYSRDLLCLLRNYVSFADFYALSEKTIFLVGKLYLDRRACALCVRVVDAGKHSTLAGKSNCCLIYCDCVRRSDGRTMTIAAVFGDGDADFLHVGRNGVFFDKKGADWDATITKIIEQPISIRQAFWSPYKKFARFVETQINNFAASKDKGVPVENVPATSGANVPAAQKPATFDIAKYVGIFAAIGLAVGALGAGLAALGAAFLSLAWWQMPLAILGLILLISCPSMILAFMKLRGRTLAPILDANSWAINGRVKINIPLGKAYTEMSEKPKNSKTDFRDPFKPKGFPWGKLLFVCILLGAAGFISVKYSPYVREKIGLEEKSEPAPAPAESVPAESPAPSSSSESASQRA